MKKVEALVDNNDEQEPKERFWELHDLFHDFGKHLTRRYDGLGGSQYAITILTLYLAKLITKEDVERFTSEIQEWIFYHEKMKEKEREII